jgi:hypothetical protein
MAFGGQFEHRPRTQPARAAPAKNKLSRSSLGFNSNTRPPPGRAGQTWVKCTSLTPIGTAGYWYNENAAASGQGPRRLHTVGKPSSEKSRLKAAPCPLLLTPTDICCLSFPSRTLPHRAACPPSHPLSFLPSLQSKPPPLLAVSTCFSSSLTRVLRSSKISSFRAHNYLSHSYPRGG